MYQAYSAQFDLAIVERDFAGEWLLFILGLYPSPMYRSIDALGGNVVRAQKSVSSGGLQYDQNVSTRNEVSRWFGTSILFSLYVADMVTSGTDNDWGYGINHSADEVWFCDSTLRFSPE